MSTTEPKKARVLTEEHKAKMAAGRVAAAAKRAAEKTTVAVPVTPTKVKEVVCPPAPKKTTPQEKLLALSNEAKEKRLADNRAKRALEKAEHDKKVAERREVKTKALMIEAAAPLAYYKKVLAAVEAIDGVKRDEVLAFFNDKIEDLEADVAGKPRYAYVLGVKEDNGDTDYNYTKVFKTSQQVSAYVALTVSNWVKEGGEGDNDDDLNEPFPTAERIDASLGNAEYGSEIQLFAYGDPYVSCLSFSLNRNRLN